MDDIFRNFQNPPASYRPQPFWFLNHRLEAERLRWQIRQMAEQGVGGVVLHARHGMLTPHMSEEWLEAIGLCVEELRAQGMEAWLYDEDNWPSGIFGGRLTRPHPEYRMRYLRVETIPVEGGATFQCTLEPDDNTLLCAQAIRLDEQGKIIFHLQEERNKTEAGEATSNEEKEDASVRFSASHQWISFPLRQTPSTTIEMRDVSSFYAQGRFRWQAPPGQWLLAFFWECPVAAKVTFFDSYYLDTMNEEAVRAFRELAYTPYDRFREEYGRTIKGIFTDEPGLMIHDGFFKVEAMRTTVQDLQRTLPGVALAWTRDFEEKFRALYGYDIRPLLIGLLYDIGPETNKLRQDYFRAISIWYSENYHGQLSLWCRERQLEYIGHTLEEPLFNQVRTQGNQTWILSHMDRPGLDYLGHGVGTSDNPYRILSCKCAASVAHVQGKPRVMCEAFGGSGHGHTLHQRRLDANFMAALGVNMIIPHAFYYSFEGYRKTDWPPTEFYHQPYWQMYKPFADYLGRLCYIQSLGSHISGTAILNPVKTMYADMFCEGRAVKEPACQKLHTQLSELLLALHYDYDYLDDSQLPQANIEAGLIKFPQSQETYALIFLPGVRVISVAAWLKLREFFAAGGKIVAFGDLPVEADVRGQDETIQTITAEIFGKPDRYGNRHNTNEAGGVAIAAQPKDLRAWLLQHLPQLLDPDVTITDRDGQPVGEIICCHRRNEAFDSYLLVNRSWQPVSCLVTVAQQGKLEEWALETGERGPVECRLEPNGKMQIPLEFEPAEARLLVVMPGEPEEIVALPEPTILERIELPSEWEFQAEGGNVLILDRWEFIARDYAAGQAERAPDKVNSYHTRFWATGSPRPVHLVLDDTEQWLPAHLGFLAGIRSLEVYVNGQPAPPLSPAEWQDPDFAWTDISDLLVEGENSLEIRTISLLEPMHGLREPVYLVGNFQLQEHEGHYVIQPPQRTISGFFTDNGYPHFAGLGRYRQIVHIPEGLSREKLILDPGHVEGCMRVFVNGQIVATRIWPPYEVDISGAVRGGANEIIIEVAGTVANLYGKQRLPYGLRGRAVIWILA